MVSYTSGGWVAGSSPFNIMTNSFVTESTNLVKTFRENLIKLITRSIINADLP